MQQWTTHLGHAPKSFLKSVKAFYKTPIANVNTQWVVNANLRTFSDPITCTICEHISFSLQAHSVHMFRVHDVKSCMRTYVVGTHCLVCLRECHTRFLHLNHVRYRSSVCRPILLLRELTSTQDEANSLDGECKSSNRVLHASGKRRHHVETPSFYRLVTCLTVTASATTVWNKNNLSSPLWSTPPN